MGKFAYLCFADFSMSPQAMSNSEHVCVCVCIYLALQFKSLPSACILFKKKKHCILAKDLFLDATFALEILLLTNVNFFLEETELSVHTSIAI